MNEISNLLRSTATAYFVLWKPGFHSFQLMFDKNDNWLINDNGYRQTREEMLDAASHFTGMGGCWHLFMPFPWRTGELAQKAALEETSQKFSLARTTSLITADTWEQSPGGVLGALQCLLCSSPRIRWGLPWAGHQSAAISLFMYFKCCMTVFYLQFLRCRTEHSRYFGFVRGLYFFNKRKVRLILKPMESLLLLRLQQGQGNQI